jgi:hypothetical protein
VEHVAAAKICNAFATGNKFYKLDQSICTLISNLSGRHDIFLGSGTLKKLGPNMGCKKQSAKNRVIGIQKEKRSKGKRYGLFSF